MCVCEKSESEREKTLGIGITSFDLKFRFLVCSLLHSFEPIFLKCNVVMMRSGSF